MTVNGNHGNVVGSTAVLSTDQWGHVAVMLSVSTGPLYVGGKKAVGTNTGMFLEAFRLGSTTQNLLGKSQYSADRAFNGPICDFYIHCGACSAAQFVSLMNS